MAIQKQINRLAYMLIPFSVIFLLVGCGEGQKKIEPLKQLNSPPPLMPDIDFLKQCDLIKNKKEDSLFKGNIYIVRDSSNYYDSANFSTRILFEYLLKKKFNILSRPVLNPLDTSCIRPFYDKVIKNRTHLSSPEIIANISNEIKATQARIGYNQIEKDIYFACDVYPSYGNGIRDLYFDVVEMQRSLGLTSKQSGIVMFYCIIDTVGKIKNIDIYQHLSPEADSLTNLIMQQLPNKWSPAKINGNKVNSFYQYAIRW